MKSSALVDFAVSVRSHHHWRAYVSRTPDLDRVYVKDPLVRYQIKGSNFPKNPFHRYRVIVAYLDLGSQERVDPQGVFLPLRTKYGQFSPDQLDAARVRCFFQICAWSRAWSRRHSGPSKSLGTRCCGYDRYQNQTD